MLSDGNGDSGNNASTFCLILFPSLTVFFIIQAAILFLSTWEEVEMIADLSAMLR